MAVLSLHIDAAQSAPATRKRHLRAGVDRSARLPDRNEQQPDRPRLAVLLGRKCGHVGDAPRRRYWCIPAA
jgi:hypothetical protein